MSRSPLALSAAGGSFATLAWQLFSDSWGLGLPNEPPFCDCPAILPWLDYKLDIPSLLLGLILGIFLGPVLDCLVLLRQLWTSFLRRQVLGLFRPSNLYRVV
jgi:hypothetical protein